MYLLNEFFPEMKITMQERPSKNYLFIPVISRWGRNADQVAAVLILEGFPIVTGKNKKG